PKHYIHTLHDALRSAAPWRRPSTGAAWAGRRATPGGARRRRPAWVLCSRLFLGSLPAVDRGLLGTRDRELAGRRIAGQRGARAQDRKNTRLNSSHVKI